MIDRHALGQLLAPSHTVVSIYLPIGGSEPARSPVLANAEPGIGPSDGLARCSTAPMPLQRLLRLSLFPLSVGMAVALLISALGRFAVIGAAFPPG